MAVSIKLTVSGLTSIAVQGIDVLHVQVSESVPLAQVTQGDAGVDRNNGGLVVLREGMGAVVHDGADVIGDSLSGDEGRIGDIEIILSACCCQ